MDEARILGAEVVAEARLAAITLEVLSLPESGEPPADRRIQLLLSPVGRVAASLRLGAGDDAEAPVEAIELGDLLKVVEGFKGAIYGVDFFDRDEKEIALWADRLSLDWRSGPDGFSHSLYLFQEGAPRRHLDLCIWFDQVVIKDPLGRVIPIEEFIAGGNRWWEAFRNDDPRTRASGIVPLRKA